MIDYEDGLDDDLAETFDAQNQHQGKNSSKQNSRSKEKKTKSNGTMNGQGGSTSSQMTSPIISSSGRPSVERFPSYSSDVEAGHVTYSPDGKALMNVETEENIKCIVTSSIFIAIIILVFVMMFTINPPE